MDSYVPTIEDMTEKLEELSGDEIIKCQVCRKVQPKYRCPRCFMMTCSLVCVKKHKQDSQCNGIRDKTAFVKLSKFTDLTVLSDYCFLEELGRKTDSASRDPLRFGNRDLPRHLKTLRDQILRRGTTLEILPRVFSKRKQNKTRYFRATNQVMWMVEWVFPQSGVKYSERYEETAELGRSLMKLYDPLESSSTVRHAVQPYVQRGVAGVTLLLRQERCPANQQRYYKMDPSKTIQESLKGKLVIEYPTIYVVFNENVKNYLLAGAKRAEEEDEEEETTSDSEEEEEDMKVEKLDEQAVPRADDIFGALAMCLGSPEEKDSEDSDNSVNDEPQTKRLKAHHPGIEEVLPDGVNNLITPFPVVESGGDSSR